MYSWTILGSVWLNSKSDVVLYGIKELIVSSRFVYNWVIDWNTKKSNKIIVELIRICLEELDNAHKYLEISQNIIAMFKHVLKASQRKKKRSNYCEENMQQCWIRSRPTNLFGMLWMHHTEIIVFVQQKQNLHFSLFQGVITNLYRMININLCLSVCKINFSWWCAASYDRGGRPAL